VVRCPHCNSPIDHLLLEGRAYSKLFEGGNYETQEPDFDGCEDYLCPMCGAVVATKEEGAISFLNKAGTVEVSVEVSMSIVEIQELRNNPELHLGDITDKQIVSELAEDILSRYFNKEYFDPEKIQP
jgi:hypothetical protein